MIIMEKMNTTPQNNNVHRFLSRRAIFAISWLFQFNSVSCFSNCSKMRQKWTMKPIYLLFLGNRGDHWSVELCPGSVQTSPRRSRRLQGEASGILSMSYSILVGTLNSVLTAWQCNTVIIRQEKPNILKETPPQPSTIKANCYYFVKQ